MLQIKNNNNTILEIRELGISIPANSTYTVQIEDFSLYYNENSNTELESKLDSGDITLIFNTVELTLQDAKNKLKFPSDSKAVTFDGSGTSLSSVNVEDAIIEAKDSAEGKARYTIILSHNGTMSNNEFIGYTELIPGNSSPIIFPRNSVLEDITFTNNRTSADYGFEFRKNSTTTTPFLTVSYDNTQTFIINDINESFNANDRIYIKYKDQGANARDAVMVLYMRVA